MSERSNYVALGLEPGVPSAEIKRAYRNLTLKFHPDASRNPDTANRFARVVRAYKTLCALPEPPLGERPVGERPVGERPRGGRSAGSQESAVAGGGSHSASYRAAALTGGEPADLFVLGSILVSSDSVEERALAARHLGLSGRRSAWVFLRKGLYDSHSSVAGACVRAAAALGLAQGAGEIASAYIRCGAELREAILEAARATGDKILLPAIEAACADEDPKRRAAALELKRRMAMAQSGSSASSP
ncbi:MAG TPA: hypothetical protein DCG47_08115 [Spirochaetaceae bacterium]|jgi:hypothetical protein|nr:hypothetical protein [Spirochaetaceae bacterium]